MNVHDVLINAVGGAAVAFIGTFVISFLRSPKLLDDERIAEIGIYQKAKEVLVSEHDAKLKATEATISELKKLLVAKQPLDVAKETIVKGILAKLDAHPRGMGGKALEWLLTNGRSDEAELLARFNHPNIVQHIEANSMPHKIIIITDPALLTGQYLSRTCEINPEFKLALQNVLHPSAAT